MEGPTTSQPPPDNAQDEELSKLDLPDQLQKITPATELPASLSRWNSNEEIAAILIAFDRHKEWLLVEPRTRPPSGSLLLYNRKKVSFRRDGYCWKKRRDGKTNREDHMKLKVKGVENPHVVLVHYLNVPNHPNNPKPSLMPILSGEMRKKEWTKEELVDQLRPMWGKQEVGVLCLQQQSGQLGGCVSTMAHLQVSASAMPDQHHHQVLQNQMPSTAAATLTEQAVWCFKLHRMDLSFPTTLCMESQESSLLAHIETLTKLQWSSEHMYPKAGCGGLTLLHLASALGYAKLISALIRWRSSNPSPALEFEVDAHSVDNHACTPLMWACAKGQIDAALTLYHWNGGPLRVCNKDGHLPLAVARQRGHHNLATQVEQLEQAHFKAPAPAPAKVISPNTASHHHPLSKRYSVDLLTSDPTEPASSSSPSASYHMRDSTSEPRLPLKQESEFGQGQESQAVPGLELCLGA
nr:hypothetical protein BaRGS_006556 [Batillaria attramentaria]